MLKAGGPILQYIYSAIAFLTAVVDAFFYFAVWIKISRTSRMFTSTPSDSAATFKFQGGKKISVQDQTTYNKTAQTLTLFVVAFFAQWWPISVYSIWDFIATPPIILVELSAIFCNLGGVFNFIAYTLVRRKQNSK